MDSVQQRSDRMPGQVCFFVTCMSRGAYEGVKTGLLVHLIGFPLIVFITIVVNILSGNVKDVKLEESGQVLIEIFAVIALIYLYTPFAAFIGLIYGIFAGFTGWLVMMVLSGFKPGFLLHQKRTSIVAGSVSALVTLFFVYLLFSNFLTDSVSFSGIVIMLVPALFVFIRTYHVLPGLMSEIQPDRNSPL